MTEQDIYRRAVPQSLAAAVEQWRHRQGCVGCPLFMSCDFVDDGRATVVGCIRRLKRYYEAQKEAGHD